VKKSVDEIPGRVDNVVQTVASIPDQVRTKSEEVQASFRTGVENTQKTIQEIQAIPSKIENSIKNTQEKAKATKKAFDETTTKVKVFAGLEKPKPKPPKTPPPPPPTAKDVGLKVAGSVVSGTAKAAWWVSKGVAGVAWNGVTAAYKNATEKKEEKGTSPAKATKAPEVGVKVVEPPKSEPATKLSSATKGTADQQKDTQESVETKKSSRASGEVKSEMAKDERSKSASASATGSDTSDVDKEVEEALRQAETALNFADEESSKRPETKENDENTEDQQ
jgi:hypothetical protein